MGKHIALKGRLPRSAAALAVVCVAGALLAAACTSSASSQAAPIPTLGSGSVASSSGQTAGSPAQGGGCKVGFSLDNYGPERYPNFEGPAIEAVLDPAGVKYTMSDAKGNADTQASQIDEFVAAGTNVIMVDPLTYMAEGVPAAVKKATDAGIAVISFDQFLENAKVLFVGFDWVDVGRMEAKAILAAKPTGNYAIIKGDPESPMTDMIRRGIGEVLQPALDSGAIKIVGEPTTVNWDPTTAEGEMDALLQKNANKIDAVIAEDDGLAAGAIKSLTDAGLAGKVPVASAGLNAGFVYPTNYKALANGVEIVDVWSDYRQLGKAAAEVALQLCKNPDIAKVSGTAPFTTPGGTQLTSILLKATPITVDNLSIVIGTLYLTKDDICKDLDPAKAPAVCR
jgi:D-xylose transport system substrate-binding protein